jgi:hypothetical protein
MASSGDCARFPWASFPELVAACCALGDHDVILDGEIIVMGGGGRPNCRLLQRRLGVGRPRAWLQLRLPARQLSSTYCILMGKT